ncbi:lantibiotic dehydratase [uncultured Pedobacter sp.]|uniref:lantibiotic dehydratase n=1 Tax=uncultured Pedobacter sp. TaxID=246139 RepID=UPI0025D227C5|nr:lantibiotic dehydratase [uncultured Pedobacter sp.]
METPPPTNNAIKRFFLYDFFLLRTPTFPIESVLVLNALLNQYVDRPKDAVVVEQTKKIFSDPLFMEAIYFASNDLYKALVQWLEGGNLSGDKEDRLIRSLHRYYSRMCTRCTPYGLFAGCAYGEIEDEQTKFSFAKEKIRKHARFDMGFISELVKKISRIKEIKEQTLFYVNNSLYKAGERYIYVENITRDGIKSYNLSALHSSSYIDKVLSASAGGATLSQLENLLYTGEIPRQSLGKFLNGLVDMQVLISELSPTVTGTDFTTNLIQRLAQLKNTAELVKPLKEAYGMLQKKNITLANHIEAGQKAAALVGYSFSGVIQEDVYYNMENNRLSKKTVKEITNLSERLFSASGPSITAHLEDFIRKFTARYEQQEIPLVKAIDPDFGIGYGLAVSGISENMPLLKGLNLRMPLGDSTGNKNAFSKLVAEKMKYYYKTGDKVLTIDDKDIDQLIKANTSAHKAQRNSAYIFGSLLSQSTEELDKGNYKFLVSQLHAFGVGRLLGRFALGEEKLHDKLKQCFKDEELANPDLILAEVVHMPEGHGGNVVLRPQFRRYEIPYMSSSSLDPDHQIGISDLLVSVRNQRLVLRSKKLGKEILPQLSHAHNAHLGQPIYRFLSDVRSQQVNAGFQWDWTGYTDEQYLPRIEYGKFILARGRWKLKREKESLLNNPKAISDYFNEIRKQRKLPRYVVMVQDGDNELFVDLENTVCCQHVARRLKKQDVYLFEFLNTPENCLIRDASGSYNHQVIIPLGTRQPIFKETFSHPQHQDIVVDRHFAPGSDWLYLKIYGGNKILEKLLTELIMPFALDATERMAIDKWFFLRYNDPDGHLRIRFHRSSNLLQWLSLLPDLTVLLDPYLKNAEISNISVDTYSRELERYGASTIEESESFFHADSIAVSNCLNQLKGDEGEELRWQIGIYGVNKLLEDFSLSLVGKLEIISELKTLFTDEFGSGNEEDISRLEKSLNDKFRISIHQVKSVLENKENNSIGEFKLYFDARSIINSATVESIITKTAQLTDGSRFLQQLIKSYVHMFLNRLFLSRQRAHELVIYHYLFKYYRSALAQGKYVLNAQAMETINH